MLPQQCFPVCTHKDICCGNKIFLKNSRNIFCCSNAKNVSATNVSSASFSLLVCGGLKQHLQKIKTAYKLCYLRQDFEISLLVSCKGRREKVYLFSSLSQIGQQVAFGRKLHHEENWRRLGTATNKTHDVVV